MPDAAAAADAFDARPAPRSSFDLVVQGTGLGDFEGFVVFASSTQALPAGPKLQRSHQVIKRGAFQVSFPGALSADHATFIRLVIDTDGDGLCAGGELASVWREQAGYDATLPLTSRHFASVATAQDCVGW